MNDNEPNDSDTSSDDEGGSADSSDLTTTNEEADISDEEREKLEKEREERLDPENRPENAEVDNTGREFDVEKGEFTYAPGEEPDGKERAQAVIGADRPEGVDVDEEIESTGGSSDSADKNAADDTADDSDTNASEDSDTSSETEPAEDDDLPPGTDTSEDADRS